MRPSVTLPQNAARESPATSDPRPRRRFRRWIILFGLAVLVPGLWFGGRQLWAWHHLRAAEQALKRYEFSEALDEFECCLQVWDTSIPLRLQAARAARRGGRLDRADKHLEVCEKTAVTPESALERALIRAQKGDLKQWATPLMNLVREGHPDTVLILEALSKGLIIIDRPREAVAVVSMLLEKAPDHPEAHFLRGHLSEQDGQLGNALRHYRRALELAPHRTPYQVWLANALVQSGQSTEARPLFEELLRRSPDDPAVLLGATRCMRALGQSQAALVHLDALLRDHPDHAEGWVERGRAWKEQGNISEALRCLRRGFELAPRDRRIGFLLLTELRAQNQVQEAAAVWGKVERLEQDEKRHRELPKERSK
jgi:tetratricopeptide (TPR) repeat protein